MAQEAQVPRNALTLRRINLMSEFYAKVTERGQPADAEKRLRQQVTKLKELRERDGRQLAPCRPMSSTWSGWSTSSRFRTGGSASSWLHAAPGADGPPSAHPVAAAKEPQRSRGALTAVQLAVPIGNMAGIEAFARPGTAWSTSSTGCR
ncbi:hypothetical protein GCM10009753_68180 [Streptantibioticus ferralitis]